MDYGVLRVSETAEAETEATRAFVLIEAKSDRLMFGNAALEASEEMRAVIARIKQVSESVEVEVESVSTQSTTGVFGKNSTATYLLKLTISDLAVLGTVLGICSEGKQISVRSLLWDYDDDGIKLQLAKTAMQKAKTKAEQMMAAVGYKVMGIRSCSDSYQMPNVGELILNEVNGAVRSPTSRTRGIDSNSSVDLGTQFQRKKKISATCTIEFLIQAEG